MQHFTAALALAATVCGAAVVQPQDNDAYEVTGFVAEHIAHSIESQVKFNLTKPGHETVYCYQNATVPLGEGIADITNGSCTGHAVFFTFIRRVDHVDFTVQPSQGFTNYDAANYSIPFGQFQYKDIRIAIIEYYAGPQSFKMSRADNTTLPWLFEVTNFDAVCQQHTVQCHIDFDVAKSGEKPSRCTGTPQSDENGRITSILNGTCSDPIRHSFYFVDRGNRYTLSVLNPEYPQELGQTSLDARDFVNENGGTTYRGPRDFELFITRN